MVAAKTYDIFMFICLAALLLAVPSAVGQCQCDEGCVGTWDKCGGNGIDGSKACSKTNDQCLSKNIHYAQCRPIDRSVPAGWEGTVLECTSPGGGCDQSTADFISWDGVTGAFQIDNPSAEIDFFSVGDLAVDDTTCAAMCRKDENCVIYEETADGDCYTFNSNLFEIGESILQPWFDSSIFVSKCFEVDPPCAPGEVVELPLGSTGTFYVESNEDFRTSGVAASIAVDACARICRQMNPVRGVCVGFNLQPFEMTEGAATCTPLFRDSSSGPVFNAEAGSVTYSIESCLPDA